MIVISLIILTLLIVLISLINLTSSNEEDIDFDENGPKSFETTWNDGVQNIPVFIYEPTNFVMEQSPVFFVIHGANKNAKGYRDYCIPLAEKYNAVLVAPKFDVVGYSKGGSKKSYWTFSNATTVFNNALNLYKTTMFVFLAHSGGAQMITRYMFKEPQFAKNAMAIISCNAGTYAFPSDNGKWPYQINTSEIDPIVFSFPVYICLGQDDTKHDAEAGVMDVSEEANAQGPYRLSRGRNYFVSCETFANEHGFKFNWQEHEFPGIGHDAKGMFNYPTIQVILSRTFAP